MLSIYSHIHRVLEYSFLSKHPKIACCMPLCSVASFMSDSLQPHGLEPTRLLCPWWFSQQEFWSGLSSPPPRDLPDPGIKPALAGRFFTTGTTWGAWWANKCHLFVLCSCDSEVSSYFSVSCISYTQTLLDYLLSCFLLSLLILKLSCFFLSSILLICSPGFNFAVISSTVFSCLCCV